MTRPHRQGRQGYTIIEAMMAVAILAVGSVGIFAMQQAATRANVEARQMTIATALSRTWTERIRRDALNWTTPGGGPALARTSYLRNVPAGAGAGAWFTPISPVPTESFAFDWYGFDTAVAANRHYCTNVRMRWLAINQAIRADVRVWWVRRQGGGRAATGGGDARLINQCAAGGEGVATANIGPGRPLKAIFTSTVVRWLTPS